jgi:hypothetical protein
MVRVVKRITAAHVCRIASRKNPAETGGYRNRRALDRQKSNVRWFLRKASKEGAIPKTRLVSGMALEKAAKCPLFPLNLRLLSQKLKFWESLKGMV